MLTYLDLARRIMGKGWAGPRTMRFGASGVLADLLVTLDGHKAERATEKPTKKPGEGY